jgi:hypothetical protein
MEKTAWRICVYSVFQGIQVLVKMSSTLPYWMLSDPSLLDVVDNEWATDRLPDDGEILPDRAFHFRLSHNLCYW